MFHATNAKVCASIVAARSFFAKAKGRATTERKSCGMNASDSKCRVVEAAGDELRYRTVLYGEKLCR